MMESEYYIVKPVLTSRTENGFGEFGVVDL